MKRITYKVTINSFEMTYTAEGINESKCYEALLDKIRKDVTIEKVSSEDIAVSKTKNFFNKLHLLT